MDKFNNIHIYLYLFFFGLIQLHSQIIVPEGGKIAKALKMNS